MKIRFRVEGKMSTFGGPTDKGMKSGEGLALWSSPQDMMNHGLTDWILSEASAKAPGLGRRLNPEQYYIACRWDYSETPRSFLRTTSAWVENPKTGKRLIARPMDWGPNLSTGRVADLSPGLAKALGLKTDDVCNITISEEATEFDTDYTHHTIQPLAIAGPRIYTTKEWAALPAKVSYFPEHAPEGIVIHHTAGANRAPFNDPYRELEAAFATAQQIQRDHFARGWSDTGQHFTISQGGIICEGRHGTYMAAQEGRVLRGAHAPGANDEWWGIEVAGNNTTNYVVTEPQWATLVALCRWLQQVSGRPLQVQPHRHFKSTICPGKLENHMDELRQAMLTAT